MVFKKLLGAMGVGGPSVDTQLQNSVITPGAELRGTVLIQGGQQAAEIDYVTLSLVTTVEVETDEGQYQSSVEFHRVPVSGGFALAQESTHNIDFSFPIPHESPITTLGGHRFSNIPLGVRTELAIAKAVDKGDLDSITTTPGPAQEAVFAALSQLGFRVKSADLERGRIRGISQTLPFYQEIEFFAAPRYARMCSEMELTFVANATTVDVILEVDKRGGLFSGSRDVFHHLRVPQTGFENTDWAGQIDAWFQGLGGSRL
ncbi:MAG: sporulation protein [Angustibacter sp.]